MKKLQILFLVLSIFLSFDGFSQTKRIPLSDKSIVKDSAGLVYTYENWSSLIKTGEYKLVKNTAGSDEYFIVGRESVNEKENKQIYGANSGNFVGKKIKFPYMTDIRGKDYWNDALKDKVVVLNFWFVKCPPCKAEIPLLNDMYLKYKDHKDVVFVAICLDNEETIRDFIKITPFAYSQVPSGLEIAKQFSVASYPTNLIIDKGIVKYGTTGFTKANLDKADAILKQLLPIVKN